MAEENKEQEQEEKKGGKKKLIIIAVLLLVILAGGGGAAYKFLVLDKQKEEEQENKAEKIQEEIKDIENLGIMFEVGTFIVNLADKDADRFLKVTVILEIENEQVKMEVEKRLPQIKDAITTLLFTKNSRELKTAEGIELLKEEIIKRVNAILPLGGVKNVYFTDFVIQTA
ncbi:flagellar basal body-associated FliL family protein [Persephonella sp.]